MVCTLEHGPEFMLVGRRNNSLSASGRILVFCFIAAVSLGIAVAFAYLGAWLILPFAGAELIVLAWAFCSIQRHRDDYERLTIEGDTVRIEVAEIAQIQSFRFNRYWAQLVWEKREGRLALRSHGREVEFGRHWTANERATVAAVLKKRLHSR